MAKFRNMNLGVKIGLGFGVSTLALICVVLITIHQVKNMEALTKRVAELRTPTAHASLMMLNGMNHSLASLRGWIILGDEKFKVERDKAWSQQIVPSLKKMHDLSSKWTDPENIGRLKVIEGEIENFEKVQKKIEDIAQSMDNTPARKILMEKANPLEKIIISNVSYLIKQESRVRNAGERNKLMNLLVDIESSTTQAMERVEEFLLSGKDTYQEQYLEHWNKSTAGINALSKLAHLLNPGQTKAFSNLVQARNQLELLLQIIVKIRAEEKWNMANYLLASEAAPVAEKIKLKLNEMSTIQEELLEEDVKEVSNRTHFLITLLVLLFFASTLLSGVLGSTITRAISEPIKKAGKVAQELALGKHRQRRLQVDSHDEIGTLNKSINELIDRLQENDPANRQS